MGPGCKNTHPDLQIEIEQGDARDFFVYQWYGDDGPCDDWVANEDDLAHYLEETAWEIEWHPELQNAGPMELGSRFRGEEKQTGSVVVRLWDGRRPSNQPQLRGRAAWEYVGAIRPSKIDFSDLKDPAAWD